MKGVVPATLPPPLLLLLLLLLLPFFTPSAKATGTNPPGKPTLTICRSPEKETFTCWWKPGPSGGLPTTYRLYYRKENSEAVYECPDYQTAGENSCFFNKNDTSIWVNYNITVVATNELGSTVSDPVDIDVMYIVMPHPPEKVAVSVMEDKDWPFLRVSWEPPHKADTRSGWITLIYEVRVKLEEEDEWEVHLAGQQKMFNIFSLRSGGTYLVQVRCKPDHGYWSEWTSSTYVQVPDYFPREKSVWVLITVFSAFVFLIFTWLILMNRRSLKHYILPPVPGPKIKGFDKQLLKNGKSVEVFSALVVSDFPPTQSSNYEDLLVEYLEVYVPEEQELMLEERKLHNGFLKSEGPTSDNDSGLGSCNSRTLLMDKSGEIKEEAETDQDGAGAPTDWEGAPTCAREDVGSPDMSTGRVKTWPSVFSPLPQYSSDSLEAAKQHCLSDSVYPPGSATPPYLTQPGTGSPYWEFCLSTKQPHLVQTHSDVDISGIGQDQAPVRLQSPTEYVEVQRVDEEDMVLLQPVALGPPQDYSRVKGVAGDNTLLLQTKASPEEEGDGCSTSSIPATGTQKPPPQDQSALPASGYVDTSVFTLPTY